MYAPRYDRAAKNPIGSAVPIAPGEDLVLIEGNYLLLEDTPWNRIRPLLGACIYLETEDDARIARLIDRHIRFGKDPDHARDFVFHSDEANARLVAATRHLADLVVRVP